jgi:hypothetical protein
MYRVFAEKGIFFASGALTLQSAPVRAGLAPSAAATLAEATALAGPGGAEVALAAPAPSRVA